MKRVTLRVPHEQVEELEDMVERGEYPNRSEAIRAGIRELLKADRRRQREPHWRDDDRLVVNRNR